MDSNDNARLPRAPLCWKDRALVALCAAMVAAVIVVLAALATGCLNTREITYDHGPVTMDERSTSGGAEREVTVTNWRRAPVLVRIDCNRDEVHLVKVAPGGQFSPARTTLVVDVPETAHPRAKMCELVSWQRL
jgi:hypothetical protein